MLLKSRDLLRLHVFTKSGTRLGRVAGFEFEAETQTILRYEVRASLLGALLLVHRNQVVSIDATRMVVEDLAVPEAMRQNLATRQGAPERQAAPLSTQSD